VRHCEEVELCRVGALDPPLIYRLKEDLASYLVGDISISERVIDPAPAFDPNRSQYSALDVMVELLREGVINGIRRIGITSVDLFLPLFTHVIGSAQLGGHVGVTSVFRLRSEFSGCPHDPDCLRSRLLKEVLHELGHTHGLVHCDMPWCVMAASMLPEHVDLKDFRFCPRCAESINVKPWAEMEKQK